jgi:hypothetical protein
LFIQVKRHAGENLYLGTVDTLPEGPEVTVLKGPVQGRVRAMESHYVLAVAGGTVGSRIWKAGYVYQWTGVKWEEREPSRYADLYMRCFADGLDAPGLAEDMGWFGALFCRMLWTQKAYIEALETRLIKLQNGGAIQSANWPDGDGFYIDGGSGDVFFGNGMFRGHIEALSGTFRGRIEAEEGYFKNGNFANIQISGNSTFEGSIKPTNGIFCSHSLVGALSVPQRAWFNVFENIIPIGRSLCVFGGMVLSYSSSYSMNIIISSITRMDADTIRLSFLGAITPNRSSVISPLSFSAGTRDCVRNNDTVFSIYHSISW